MKILITTQYYYPDSFLVNDLSFRLAEEGHDVYVLTGQGEYATGEVPYPYGEKEMQEQVIQQVKIYRAKSHPRHTGIFHRAWNYLSFAYHSNRRVKDLPTDFDLILGYQMSPISMIDAGVRLGRKHKIPILVYCLDLWPESLKAWDIRETSLLFKLAKRYSAWIYHSADKLLLSSKPFLTYMTKTHQIPEEKMAYMPQYFDDRYPDVSRTSPENGVMDFVFAGNIGAVQIVDELVLAAKVLQERNLAKAWRVHILGDGSEFDYIKRLAEEAGLAEQVILYGRKPVEELLSFYQQADVFLLTLLHENAIGDTLPAKIQGYFCAGRPVIAVAGGAAADIVRENRCGQVVNPGDIEALADIMEAYIMGAFDTLEEGKRARACYEANFTYDTFHETLFDAISEVTGRKGHE